MDQNEDDAARSPRRGRTYGVAGVVQIVTAVAALFGVIATVVIAQITSSSTRSAQTEAFEQQRKLSDRQELRDVLDEAAEAARQGELRATAAAIQWRRRHAALNRPRDLVKAIDVMDTLSARLDLRLGGGSKVSAAGYYHAIIDWYRALSFSVQGSYNPRGGATIRYQEEEGRRAQERFLNEARRLVGPDLENP